MKYGVLFFTILIPQFAFAQLEITEIMYDLSGSDAKREWVEVLNVSNATVDLTDWRFNDGKNHTFPDPEPIAAGSYAILTSDKATFLSEEESAVPVIDTVMSLTNVSDTLSLINQSGEEIFSITYDASMGAAGDGHSLQVIGGGLVAAIPTPGRENSNEQIQEASGNTDDEEVQVEGEAETQRSSYVAKASQTDDPYINPSILVNAGPDQVVLSGGVAFFEGNASGLKREPLNNARYVWSFGDGTAQEGRRAQKTFTYPGTYSVTLSATSGKFVKSDRAVVTVVEADLSLDIHDDASISISNRSTDDADISFWILKADSYTFEFPKDTILLSNNEHKFAHAVTGFNSEINKLSLLYPNTVTVIEKEFVREKVVEDVVIVPETKLKAVTIVKEEQIVPAEVLEVQEEEVEDVVSPSPIYEQQIAAVSGSGITTETKPNTAYKWYVMLVSLVGIGVILVLSRDALGSPLKESDEYTILE